MDALSPAQIEEARRLYALNYTPHRVAMEMSRFGRPTVTAAQVRAVVDLRPSGIPIDPEVKAAIRALRLQGLTPREIVEKLGVPFQTAKSGCDGIRLTDAQYAEIRKRTSKVGLSRIDDKRRGIGFAAATAARVERAAAKNLIRPKIAKPVEVPGWVPDHLHEFYEAVARRDCEEQAASICRQLKRGGSLAHL